VTAFVRAHQRSADSQARARDWIEAARSSGRIGGHVPGLLRVPADASRAEPIEPASTVAAAELLRVWIEELDRASEPAQAPGTD
jgi:hypothetical protein